MILIVNCAVYNFYFISHLREYFFLCLYAFHLQSWYVVLFYCQFLLPNYTFDSLAVLSYISLSHLALKRKRYVRVSGSPGRTRVLHQRQRVSGTKRSAQAVLVAARRVLETHDPAVRTGCSNCLISPIFACCPGSCSSGFFTYLFWPVKRTG